MQPSGWTQVVVGLGAALLGIGLPVIFRMPAALGFWVTLVGLGLVVLPLARHSPRLITWGRTRRMISTVTVALVGAAVAAAGWQLALQFEQPRISPALQAVLDEMGAAASRGDVIQMDYSVEIFNARQGLAYWQFVDYQRSRIEKWRTDTGAILASPLLRRDVQQYVLVKSGDRISEAVARLREVMRDIDKWKTA